MANITRTITTYKVAAYKVAWKNGKPVVELVGETTYAATATTKTEARKALADAGFKTARGMEIVIEEIAKQVYAMPVEQFMELAKPVEAAEVEEG